MGTLSEISKGYKAGEALSVTAGAGTFTGAERHIFDYSGNTGNALTLGDNLEYMKWLAANGYAGKFKLIYVDPPFFTKAKYDATVSFRDAGGKAHKIRHLAYDDMFERDLENYIMNMTARLILMKELLADDGTLWVHLDWHSSHYIKVILDEIFGVRNFVNEIVWKYKSGGTGKRHFSRKHDSILVYGKTSRYYLNVPQERSYNRGLKPYRFKGVKEYRDEYGWYTMVNMKDVWSIDMVGRTSAERTGYATQKPVALMERVIEASTVEGDLCADFFCGSGSFLAAAEKSGRRWIGCDSEEIAVSMAKKRMDGLSASYVYYTDGQSEPGSGYALFECLSAEELETGKKLLTYALTSFVPDIDYGHIANKDKETVQSIESSDPLELIDYIMIDPDAGESDIFNAELSVDEGFGEIKFISHGQPSFIVVDVFGKEYYAKKG
jgi:site-specific DNA-methyltransferase (adenine-specific)